MIPTDCGRPGRDRNKGGAGILLAEAALSRKKGGNSDYVSDSVTVICSGNDQVLAVF